jgi:hypothetical protein
MSTRRTMTVLALLAGAAAAVQAQTATASKAASGPRMLLELTAGAGTTIVDVDAWAGTVANDWGTVAYQGTARLFFLSMGRARIGAEVSYRYYFWYNYFPGGTSYPYEFEVSGAQLSAVARFPLGARASLDAGLGVYDFEDSSEFGAHAALGYHVPLSPTMTLPIQVRADYVITDPSLIPITVNAGIGIRL